MLLLLAMSKIAQNLLSMTQNWMFTLCDYLLQKEKVALIVNVTKRKKSILINEFPLKDYKTEQESVSVYLD
jgi:hypothetical protein